MAQLFGHRNAEELERTSVHEAGHLVMADACGGEAGAARVETGSRFVGCATTKIPTVAWQPFDVCLPFVAWPSLFRQKLEREALVSLAGEAAEWVLRPYAGPARRMPDSLIEHAAAAAAESPPTPAEVGRLAEVVSDSTAKSDGTVVEELARMLFPGDFQAMMSWLAFMQDSARSMIAYHEPEVRRLAAALAEHGTLSAVAVNAIIRGDAAA